MGKATSKATSRVTRGGGQLRRVRGDRKALSSPEVQSTGSQQKETNRKRSGAAPEGETNRKRALLCLMTLEGRHVALRGGQRRRVRGDRNALSSGMVHLASDAFKATVARHQLTAAKQETNRKREASESSGRAAGHKLKEAEAHRSLKREMHGVTHQIKEAATGKETNRKRV